MQEVEYKLSLSYFCYFPPVFERREIELRELGRIVSRP